MITYKVQKPIYGLCVAIRDKVLNSAIKKKTSIRAEWNGEVYIIDPKKWVKTGERMEKVFLIPDRPMVLFSNHLSKFPTEEQYNQTFPVEQAPINVMSKMAERPEWEDLRRIFHK